MTQLTAEVRMALRAAVDSGVQTMCRNCLHGVQYDRRAERWTHGPGGWEGVRCPRRLTGAEPFEFGVLLGALDALQAVAEAARFCLEHGQITNNGDRVADALAALGAGE